MSDMPLTLGMVGENVTALHQALSKQGFSILEAEAQKQFFGPATRMAVGEFQKANGIEPSCEVCMTTAAKLGTGQIATNADNYSEPSVRTFGSQAGMSDTRHPRGRDLVSQVDTVANSNQPLVRTLISRVGAEQQFIEPKAKRRLPTHLSVFALAKDTGHPIARMPFYAEVAVVSVLPQPVCNLPRPLQDAIHDKIIQLTGNELTNESFINLLCDKLCRLPAPRVIEKWAGDYNSAAVAVDLILQTAWANNGNMDWNNPQILGRLLEEVILAYLKRNNLPLAEADAPDSRIAWAYPLGVLATDHVGYLSFDLSRLPQDVAEAVALAIEERRRDPNTPTATSIWIYPMAQEERRIDALEQMRFADDAIVVRLSLNLEPGLELCQRELCGSIKNLGIAAMQSPDMTDWRLSPGSFATSPDALVGADGCEMVLPSNIALHEFNFYQVIGVPATDVNLPISPVAAERVRPGFINEYRVSFIPIGHALGQILYSMPLAPGETVKLAVIDWMRRDDAQRIEDTELNERLNHEQHRDRTISETVTAAIKEYQHGSSFMGGIAGSVGGAIGMGGMGAAAGLAGSLGGSTSNSSGTRDIAMKTVQNLSDNITQASTAMRELHSTVVVHSTQNEHEAIETRTVVNYNHSHSLTILYYEVLRHFRVVTEFVGRRPALLTNIHGGIAYLVTDPNGTQRHEIYWPAIYENRNILEAALLDVRFKDCFDIVERRRHHGFVNLALGRKKDYTDNPQEQPKPPYGPALRFFVFDMLTGGWTSDETERNVRVHANVWLQSEQKIQLVAREDNTATRLNPNGTFRIPSQNNSFVGTVPYGQTINLDEIDMIQIYVDLYKTDVSFQHIKVAAIDAHGNEHCLVNKTYESGHLTLNADSSIDLPTFRPPPPPPPPGRPAEEIEEEAKFLEFNEHLLNNRAHYERALRLGSTPAQRAFELANLEVGGGASLLEKVDSRPLEVLGDYVAYPCIDSIWSTKIMDKIKALNLAPIEPIERLVTLPTRGVFSEAKLGHCNASEEIDNTRFWKWEEHPIPHSAPEIAAIEAGKHVVKDPNLQPTPFPQSLVNIVNPPNAPDSTGLASAMNMLATSNIFRDMSGRSEVADLLKKLSDNSVAIAGVAQNAASYGGGKGVTSGVPSSVGGSISEPNLNSVGTGTGRSADPTTGSSLSSAPQTTQEQVDKEMLANQKQRVAIAEGLPPRKKERVLNHVADQLTKQPAERRLSFSFTYMKGKPMYGYHQIKLIDAVTQKPYETPQDKHNSSMRILDIDPSVQLATINIRSEVMPQVNYNVIIDQTLQAGSPPKASNNPTSLKTELYTGQNTVNIANVYVIEVSAVTKTVNIKAASQIALQKKINDQLSSKIIYSVVEISGSIGEEDTKSSGSSVERTYEVTFSDESMGLSIKPVPTKVPQ